MFFRFFKGIFRSRSKCPSQEYWTSRDRYVPPGGHREMNTASVPVQYVNIHPIPKRANLTKQRPRVSSTTSSFFSAEASPRRMRPQPAQQHSAPNLHDRSSPDYYRNAPLPPTPVTVTRSGRSRSHGQVPSPHQHAYHPSDPLAYAEAQAGAAVQRAQLAAATKPEEQPWRPFRKCRNCGHLNPVSLEAQAHVPCLKCPDTYSVSRKNAEKARALQSQLGGHKRRRTFTLPI